MTVRHKCYAINGGIWRVFPTNNSPIPTFLVNPEGTIVPSAPELVYYHINIIWSPYFFTDVQAIKQKNPFVATTPVTLSPPCVITTLLVRNPLPPLPPRQPSSNILLGASPRHRNKQYRPVGYTAPIVTLLHCCRCSSTSTRRALIVILLVIFFSLVLMM